MSLNQVNLIGNLGGDPEMATMPTGRQKARFSLATTDKWKDRESGEAKEKTEWHRVVFYDRLAEVAGEYARKGRQVWVQGKLRTSKWTDKDGVERYTTEVVGYDLQLLGSKPGDKAAQGAPTGPVGDDQDDDIPF